MVGLIYNFCHVIWLAHSLKYTLGKKCMQQNFFSCPNKTFCSSKQNFIDIEKFSIGTTKEFCFINTEKIFLLI